MGFGKAGCKYVIKLPDTLANVTIAVIGDVMLDRYWWGKVTRISPEAPVPVVKLGRTSVAAGGAANVAANVAGLGARAILVGVTGKDTEAEILKGLVSTNASVDCRLISLNDRSTTVKTRIVAHNQHVVRLDQETDNPISHAEINESFEIIRHAIDDAQAIIISDYAKGFLSESLLEKILDHARSSDKKVFIDPKSKDLTKYRGGFVITPNLKEASETVQRTLTSAEMIVDAAREIRSSHDFDAVLITEGENGMTLLDDGPESFHLDALAHDVFDVTGAGDTVIAVLAVAFIGGMSFRDSAAAANIAAGIAVGHIGTTVVTIREIEEFIKAGFATTHRA